MQGASAGVAVQKVEGPRAGQEVTSAGPRFDRQRQRQRAGEGQLRVVAEEPEMTAQVQDAVIPAFPRGNFSVGLAACTLDS